VRKLSLIMQLTKTLNKLQANSTHQFNVSDNHSLSLFVYNSFTILSLHIFTDEFKQILVVAILKHQIISNLHLSFYYNWFLTFKWIYIHNIWALGKDLADSVFFFSTIHLAMVNIWFKNFNTNLFIRLVSGQINFSLHSIT